MALYDMLCRQLKPYNAQPLAELPFFGGKLAINLKSCFRESLTSVNRLLDFTSAPRPCPLVRTLRCLAWYLVARLCICKRHRERAFMVAFSFTRRLFWKARLGDLRNSRGKTPNPRHSSVGPTIRSWDFVRTCATWLSSEILALAREPLACFFYCLCLHASCSSQCHS